MMKKLLRKCFKRVLTPVMSKKYNTQEEKRLVQLYKKILPLLSFISLIIGIMNYVTNTSPQFRVQTVYIFSIIVGVQILHYIAIKLKPDYFNIWQQISVPIQHLLIMYYVVDTSLLQQEFSAKDLYFMGYSIGILFYIFFNGTNQVVKVFLLVSVFIEICLFIGFLENQMSVAILSLIGITFLIASTKIIQEERRKQRLFLTNETNQIWQKVIECFLPINILMVEYDYSCQRIVLNSSNMFTQQNLKIYSDDDLQVFLDLANVHSYQKSCQSENRFQNTDTVQEGEAERTQHPLRSSQKKLSTKIEFNFAQSSHSKENPFTLSPTKRKGSDSRRRSLLQLNKLTGLRGNNRSQTLVQNKQQSNINQSVLNDKKNSNSSSSYKDKKNLKHHLKEFMIKATKDKNLNRQVYELKIEYEFENDVKLFQLKVMPFFFDQNYAIITIDNLSNEERLKNKDDVIQVQNYLNNCSRMRVVSNVEQIIRNFIQVQNKAMPSFERNDYTNTKSIFSILQASTFQMCQKTINQVKNIQTLSSSKKKTSIYAQRFSLLDQIRTILKRFSYELHKKNQKVKLFIDTTQYFTMKQKSGSQQIINEKKQSNNHSNFPQITKHQSSNQLQPTNSNQFYFFNNPHLVDADEDSFQTMSMSKYASQSQLGGFSQQEIQRPSPRNRNRSHFSNSNGNNMFMKQQQSLQQQAQIQQQNNTNTQNNNQRSNSQQNVNESSNDSISDHQTQINLPSNYYQSDSIKQILNSQKQLSELNSHQQIQFPPEFQQPAALQQIIHGVRQEEIINEEKNEEASQQNSINQSQKLNQAFLETNGNKQLNTSDCFKKFSDCKRQLEGYDSLNTSQQTQGGKLNIKKIESQLGSEISDIRTESIQMSQSIEGYNIDELGNQKVPGPSQFSQLNNVNPSKLINNLEVYNMDDKFKLKRNSFLNSQKQRLEIQISPPNSLLQQFQQSPLNSFIHNYTDDHILNYLDPLSANNSLPFKMHQSQSQDESTSSIMPLVCNENKLEDVSQSLSQQLALKYHSLVVKFPGQGSIQKSDVYMDSLPTDKQHSYLLSHLKFYNLNENGLEQENKNQKSLQGISFPTIPSPLKDRANQNSVTQNSRTSINPSFVSGNLNEILPKYTEDNTSLSNSSSQSSISQMSMPSPKTPKSKDISTINQSSNSHSFDSNQVKKQKIKKHRDKSKEKAQNKTLKATLYNQEDQLDGRIKELMLKQNKVNTRLSQLKYSETQKSTTSISCDLHREASSIENNNSKLKREDIYIYQDIGRVNNVLYNFIENSIIHGQNNSEIYIRIIQNPPLSEDEQESPYITIEITNTSLYDIEETKLSVESSQDYQFHFQNLVDKINNDDSYISLGLRSSKKNLRYIGPFDSINYSYDFPKNKIKCSFSLYKNIEILYPDQAQNTQSRSPGSPQVNSFHQSNNLHLSPVTNSNYQVESAYLSPNQQKSNLGNSLDKHKHGISVSTSPSFLKKAKYQLKREISQNHNIGSNNQGLHALFGNGLQVNGKKRSSLLKEVNLQSAQSISTKPTNKAIMHLTHKLAKLDLSEQFVNHFRNNSIYNETTSKRISKDSDKIINQINQSQAQKEPLAQSVRQNRVQSNNSSSGAQQGDQITQSIPIQVSNYISQHKGIQGLKHGQATSTFKHSLDEQTLMSQNFDQELLFKEKTNSFQLNRDDNRIDFTNSTINKITYVSGNRISNNTINITNHGNNQSVQSNSTSINQRANFTHPGGGGIGAGDMINSNLDQKISILVKSKGQQYQNVYDNSPHTNQNRSQKAFTFFHDLKNPVY